MADSKHGAPCLTCGTRTWRASQVCRHCESRTSSHLPDVARLPEDYLQRCTEELLRRHRVREEMLAKLGMLRLGCEPVRGEAA